MKTVVKVSVDLPNWQLGDWPEQIESAVDVSIEDDKSVSIRIADGVFEEVARKIAKEAIEEFFNRNEKYPSAWFEAGENGLVVEYEDEKPIEMLWDHIAITDVRGAISAAKWFVSALDTLHVVGADEIEAALRNLETVITEVLKKHKGFNSEY